MDFAYNLVHKLVIPDEEINEVIENQKVLFYLVNCRYCKEPVRGRSIKGLRWSIALHVCFKHQNNANNLY